MFVSTAAADSRTGERLRNEPYLTCQSFAKLEQFVKDYKTTLQTSPSDAFVAQSPFVATVVPQVPAPKECTFVNGTSLWVHLVVEDIEIIKPNGSLSLITVLWVQTTEEIQHGKFEGHYVFEIRHLQHRDT